MASWALKEIAIGLVLLTAVAAMAKNTGPKAPFPLEIVADVPLPGGAHIVGMDPVTHLLYFPLEDIAGKPVLRIAWYTGP